MKDYPHITKPWLKYYDSGVEKTALPQETIQEFLHRRINELNLSNSTALTYYGHTVSYKELEKHIEEAAHILWAMGVRKGDRILTLMPNIPETAYLMYGASVIGAVSDYADPRPDSVDPVVSATKVLNLIKEERVRYIVSLDQCYLAMVAPIEEKLLEIGIDQILLVSASDSMTILSKAVYAKDYTLFFGKESLKKRIETGKLLDGKIAEVTANSKLEILWYKEQIGNCKGVTPEKAPYEKGGMAILVHTSGTSSPRPKPIPISHDNMNSYIIQSELAKMPLTKGDRALHILPYFAAYGVVNVAHAGLCLGVNLIEIPEFAPAALGQMIVHYKAAIINATPMWYEMMANDPAMEKADLSMLKMMSFGGDSCSSEKEELINEFLLAHGSPIKVTKGHGMSEICGCACYADREYNIPGSVGIPLPLTTYAVMDPETLQMVPFRDGEDRVEGELVISGPAVTSGVLDGKEIVPHLKFDGESYIRTKDLVQMDRNGVLFFLSRSDRTFTRFDGYKVKCFEIEPIIEEYDGVRECVITPYLDKQFNGNMPMADLLVDEEILGDPERESEFVRALVQKQFIENPEMSTRQIPSRFRLRTSLPMTTNSKVDYRALAAEDSERYDVACRLNETNITIGELEIIHR